jgi:hypothetical protein
MFEEPRSSGLIRWRLHDIDANYDDCANKQLFQRFTCNNMCDDDANNDDCAKKCGSHSNGSLVTFQEEELESWANMCDDNANNDRSNKQLKSFQRLKRSVRELGQFVRSPRPVRIGRRPGAFVNTCMIPTPVLGRSQFGSRSSNKNNNYNNYYSYYYYHHYHNYHFADPAKPSPSWVRRSPSSTTLTLIFIAT